MAIIIPSKNIYDKDDDKVRDNAINKIEISAFEVSPNNEYNTSVYNEQVKIDDVKSSADLDNKDLKKDLRQVSGGGTSGVNVGYAFVSYSNQKVGVTQIKIPVVGNNKLIKNIKTGKYIDETTSKEENNIKVTLYGTVEKGEATATINTNDEISEPILTKTETSAVKQFSFPSTIEATYSGSALFAKASQSIKDAGNLSTVNYSIQVIDGVEYYVFDLNIFCDCTVVKLTGGAGWQSPNTPEYINMTGEYEKYVATNAELTFYGDTIGIELKDQTIQLKQENADKPFSVESNELMQTQNYIEKEIPIRIGEYIESGLVVTERKAYSEGSLLIVGESVTYNAETAKVVDYNNIEGYYILRSTAGGGISNAVEGAIINVYTKTNQIKANFIDTLNEYKNGKETAVIRCSISDYYDENGDKKLSISPYKNILSDIIIKSQTLNGVEIIVNDSGLIELTGVATKNIVLKLNNTTPITQGTYYFSGCPTGGSLISYSLRVRTTRNGALLQDYDDIGNGIAININKSDVEYFVWLMIEAGTNVNGLIFKPMLTNGSEGKEFLPIGQNSGNMFFKIYDEVIPMTYGSNGVDKPMSNNKKFKVLGTKIFYDGAVWQELHLQEVKGGL
jgi:hypothetical protein